MTIEQFTELLCGELRRKKGALPKGADWSIECRAVRKNNGVWYHGILIQQEGEPVVPYIYVDRHLNEYEEGRTLSDIADEIIELWLAQRKVVQGGKFDFTYEKIKDRIVFRLIHYQKNQEILTDVPYRQMLDLVVTFHVTMIQEEEQVGMFRIENSHLAEWGVSQEEIMQQAMENTPRLFPPRIISMNEMMGLPESQVPMYVVTNETGINGASVILYPAVLSELSDQLQADLYLLPSSIHEFIIVPFHRDYDGKSFREIVRMVNITQVSEEDYLSDEVYYYNRKKSIIQKV